VYETCVFVLADFALPVRVIRPCYLLLELMMCFAVARIGTKIGRNQTRTFFLV